MENLNMDNLASTLPSPAIVKAEQDTMDKFKAAAQSLTLLYRSSQQNAKRHYNLGYCTALEDIYSIIQHSVTSLPENERVSPTFASTHFIMDWIKARQESIRVDQGDEEEEERNKPYSTIPLVNSNDVTSRDEHDRSRTKKNFQCQGSMITPGPISSTFRNRTKQPVSSSPSILPSSPSPISSSVPSRGAKRRHTAMLLDGYPPTPSCPSLLYTQANTNRVPSDGFISSLNSQLISRRRLRNSQNGPVESQHVESIAGVHEVESLATEEVDGSIDSEDEGGRGRRKIARR